MKSIEKRERETYIQLVLFGLCRRREAGPGRAGAAAPPAPHGETVCRAMSFVQGIAGGQAWAPTCAFPTP